MVTVSLPLPPPTGIVSRGVEGEGGMAENVSDSKAMPPLVPLIAV